MDSFGVGMEVENQSFKRLKTAQSPDFFLPVMKSNANLTRQRTVLLFLKWDDYAHTPGALEEPALQRNPSTAQRLPRSIRDAALQNKRSAAQ